MKTIHETRLKSLESSAIQAKLLCTSGGHSSASQGSSSNYQNAIATAAVLIGFAIFAYSVKYVLKTMAYEEWQCSKNYIRKIKRTYYLLRVRYVAYYYNHLYNCKHCNNSIFEKKIRQWSTKLFLNEMM